MTLWIVIAHQTPLSMGFSKQEYWSGMPCSPPGDLSNPVIEPGSPALQADSLPSEPPVICSNVCIFNPNLLVYPSSPSPLVIISLFSVSMGLLLHKFGGGGEEVVLEGKETSQTELRGKNGVNLNTEGTGHCEMLAASAPLRQSLS